MSHLHRHVCPDGHVAFQVVAGRRRKEKRTSRPTYHRGAAFPRSASPVPLAVYSFLARYAAYETRGLSYQRSDRDHSLLGKINRTAMYSPLRCRPSCAVVE